MITLSLMVLLTGIAVGLLTLSAVSLRTTTQGKLMGQAQANARLGMMLALGEVQKSLGPDQRAAAPANMMVDKPAEPHVPGVWQSWTWDPTQAAAPPDYAKEKKDLFLGWLASDNQEPGHRLDADFPLDGPGDPVTLVGTGSAAASGGVAAEVRGGFTPIHQTSDDSQGYAWVALQEDVKAHVQPGAGALPATRETRVAAMFAPDESGLTGLEIAGRLGSDRAKRHLSSSTATFSLAGGDARVGRESFHHLTPYSLGLLTDAAAGGMRRDLTTEFENFSASPLKGRRVYQANGSTALGSEPWWDALCQYYNLAARVKSQAGGGATPLVLTNSTDLARFTEITGTNTVPQRPVLRPVVAKVDILFSLVTHNVDDSNEVTQESDSWNYGLAQKIQQNDPDNSHYMAWLVFEPIITLWNPYNVPIQFPMMSFGINYLPIGVHTKADFGGGWQDILGMLAPGDINYWQPIAAMNTGSGGGSLINCNFFMRLQGTTTAGGPPSANTPIKLDPGEVKVFTAYVPQNATWASVKDQFLLERGASSFYQGASGLVSNSQQGVVFTPGWNSRVGGFQIDRFKNGGSNHPWDPGSDFLVLLAGDRFKVQLRLRDNSTNMPPVTDDWRTPDPNADSAAGSKFTMQILLMTGDATFQDFQSATPAKLIQKLTVNEKDFRKPCENNQLILEVPNGVTGSAAYQAPSDTGPGGKTPFALLSLTAKPTHDLLTPTKGWLFGNPVTANATVDDNIAPYSVQPYEMVFREITGSNGFPMVDVDVQTGTRGYFGPGQTSERGLTAATMFALPCEPMVSLGQFQSANLLTSDTLPRFNYPVGNSYAHPMIPPGLVKQGALYDHSYALNYELWDGYYFSSLSSQAKVQAEQFTKGEVPLNSRLLYHAAPGITAKDAVTSMTAGEATTRSRRVPTHQLVMGAFNANSTSVEAWRAVLAGLRNRAIPTRDGNERKAKSASAIPRFIAAMTPADEAVAIGGGAGNGGAEAERAARWVGTHLLTDQQVTALARHIVLQLQNRGREDKAPILTLGEFVNRRPGSESAVQALKGVLQTAVEEANKEVPLYSAADGDPINLPLKDPPANPAALTGNTAEGSPAVLLQGDIMQEIGSFLTTHSDTLRIRAYGRAGKGANRAEAWCEAIVQRVPEYLDPADAAEDSPPKQSANTRFGRRFNIISFRWLSRNEI